MSTDELDVRIYEILHDEVAGMFRADLSELFGLIKTAMVEYFDDRYAMVVRCGAMFLHVFMPC